MCPAPVSRSFSGPWVPWSLGPCLPKFADYFRPPAHNSHMMDDQTSTAKGYALLASGCWLLAIGFCLLASGYWLLAIGYWLRFSVPLFPAFLLPALSFPQSRSQAVPSPESRSPRFYPPPHAEQTHPPLFAGTHPPCRFVKL
jgi:hypothetical protein